MALPLIAIAIPLANFLIDSADFDRRYIVEWGTSWPLALAIVWLVYALWPSAFRYFSSGVETITIDDDDLLLSTGERLNPVGLRGIEIERPAVQHARVVLRFLSTEFTIGTAFQNFGERKTADWIAGRIAEVARPSAN